MIMVAHWHTIVLNMNNPPRLDSVVSAEKYEDVRAAKVAHVRNVREAQGQVAYQRPDNTVVRPHVWWIENAELRYLHLNGICFAVFECTKGCGLETHLFLKDFAQSMKDASGLDFEFTFEGDPN